MRTLILTATLLILWGCTASTQPQRCYKQGDTLGWIVGYKGTLPDSTPLQAKHDFCLK